LVLFITRWTIQALESLWFCKSMRLMDTQEFGCSYSLPEWKFRITETAMTKLNENNVTYVKTLYNLWLQWIVSILVKKNLVYI
jgi:hypothetical protein